MDKSRREQLYEMTREEIKAHAIQQMVENGIDSLSMRAIAKEMGLTPPALYYYFSNRDELITALVLDAFHSLEEANQKAVESVSADDPLGRATALADTFRSWMLSTPLGFELISGLIPGYQFHPSLIGPIASRSLNNFFEIYQAAWECDQSQTPEIHLSSELKQQLAEVTNSFGTDVPPEIAYSGLMFFFMLLGIMTFEKSGQFKPFIADADSLFKQITSSVFTNFWGIAANSSQQNNQAKAKPG